MIDEPWYKKAAAGGILALLAYVLAALVVVAGLTVVVGLFAALGLIGSPAAGVNPLLAWLGLAWRVLRDPLLMGGKLVARLGQLPLAPALLLLPWVGFRAGAAYASAAVGVGGTRSQYRTTFRRARARVNGSPLYQRVRGYPPKLVEDHLYNLNQDGRAALVGALRRDDATALLYTAANASALWVAARLRPHEAGPWQVLYWIAVAGLLVPALACLLLGRTAEDDRQRPRDPHPVVAWLRLAAALACTAGLALLALSFEPGDVVRMPARMPWLMGWAWLLPLITLLLDLLENATLRDLAKGYEEVVQKRGSAVAREHIEARAGRVRLASFATKLKIWTFTVGYVLILCLVAQALLNVGGP